MQPESWFELGNPNRQTICIDLAYRLPGGGYPIFTSGDDESGSPPRIIARSFEEWFLELLRQEGREYWFDPGFRDFGDPWQLHRRHVPEPPLPGRLDPMRIRVADLHASGADERRIAASAGALPRGRRGHFPALAAQNCRSRLFVRLGHMSGQRAIELKQLDG